MNKIDVIEKINSILAEEFETDAALITEDAPLMETLDMDSLDLVDVVVLVEHNFGVTLVGTDFIGIETFKDFHNLITDKMDEQH